MRQHPGVLFFERDGLVVGNDGRTPEEQEFTAQKLQGAGRVGGDPVPGQPAEMARHIPVRQLAALRGLQPGDEFR